METAARLLIATLVCVAASVAQPAFEAASVKIYDPSSASRSNMRGGPGTGDPTRFSCQNCSLRTLITTAYDIRDFQLTSPSWSDRYDVEAKVPADATKEQFNSMLQGLLSERFHLQLHHQSQEMTVYTLVAAKSGSKLTPSSSPTPPDPSLPSITTAALANGTYRMAATNAPLTKLIGLLSILLAKPVHDATGLEGAYDFQCSWAGNPSRMDAGPRLAQDGSPIPADPDAESGPTLFAALQQQLGLKLESKKDQVDVLVVDHVDKLPTEN